MAIQPPTPKRSPHALADGFELAEAQFLLSDYCIQHYFDEKVLIAQIQTASDVQTMRALLLQLSGKVYADMVRPDLVKKLADCVTEINSTCP